MGIKVQAGLLIPLVVAMVTALPKTHDTELSHVGISRKSLENVTSIADGCKDENIRSFNEGVSGYNLMYGDIYQAVDPGFEQPVFKLYKKDEYDECFIPVDGVDVKNSLACDSSVNSYQYDTFESFVEQSMESSSSSESFQWGLEAELSVEIPKTEIGIKTKIPPAFTQGFENSRSSQNMKSFFGRESGHVVTSHSECAIYHMKISKDYPPKFRSTFTRAIKSLYRKTKGSAASQRKEFTRFLSNYGTHVFTDMIYGARMSLTQKYSSNTAKHMSKDALRDCTQDRASVAWFYKNENKQCSPSDEAKLKTNDWNKNSAQITTRGSAPRKGMSWYEQKFDPVPIKFQLSPIVNLFTDDTMIDNFHTGDCTECTVSGAITMAAALRKTYAPLYYNYCGKHCKCFVANCERCSVNGETCEKCQDGFSDEENTGSSCTKLRTIYITNNVGETWSFSLDGRDTVRSSISHDSTFDANCHEPSCSRSRCQNCAYSAYRGKLYLAGGQIGYATIKQVSVFEPPNNHIKTRSLKLNPGNRPFSFMLNNRMYVAGGMFNGNNAVFSRALQGSESWTEEVNLPLEMTYTSRSAVVLNGYVYITGGTNWGNGVQPGASNKAWKWTPFNDRWIELPSMAHTHADHCNVLVRNRYIVVFGGEYGSNLKSVEVFDLEQEQWSLRSPMSNYWRRGIASPSCAAVEGDVYVHSQQKLIRYDFDKDQWSIVLEMNASEYGQAENWDGGTAMMIL